MKLIINTNMMIKKKGLAELDTSIATISWIHKPYYQSSFNRIQMLML